MEASSDGDDDSWSPGFLRGRIRLSRGPREVGDGLAESLGVVENLSIVLSESSFPYVLAFSRLAYKAVLFSPQATFKACIYLKSEVIDLPLIRATRQVYHV